jgi:hypothetical protein
MTHRKTGLVLIMLCSAVLLLPHLKPHSLFTKIFFLETELTAVNEMDYPWDKLKTSNVNSEQSSRCFTFVYKKISSTPRARALI